jgi:steroid delta-isomerase-like uncharacterized protein
VAREQLTQDYITAWNSHDPGAVALFFTDDAVYDDRGAGELARGREAIRAHVESVLTAFPDLRFELVRTAQGEGFACGEWTCQMTHAGELSGLAPTGRLVSSAGVDVATLDSEDRVTHLVSYYDGAAIMRGLGLLPERDSRLERMLVRAASTLRRGRVRAPG